MRTYWFTIRIKRMGSGGGKPSGIWHSILFTDPGELDGVADLQKQLKSKPLTVIPVESELHNLFCSLREQRLCTEPDKVP